ncbi:MAG TPA: molybdopterin cofactor-binding domain-containing protein [Chthoniobacterales bacterium]|nr:molybdopterin cofactor-binding domain-containing protein [Chthoniobacterales bacterium]
MIASRRTFLKTAALSGASLVIGIKGTRLVNAASQAAGTAFQPSSWIRIDPDGLVSLTIGRTEMGQGVRTSLAMLLAEELEADWTRIKLVQAKPSPGSDLGTGGSDSIRSGWKTLRQAGAAAREMLISAAAARWKVDRETCTASHGKVVHASSGRTLGYGELVNDAARLPVPEKPPLKAREKFNIIGRRTARIDGRDIVTGRARYGIDTKIPGMLYASLERPAWNGAKLKKMDEDGARAVNGVRSIVKLPGGGVAIVASNTWAAIKGRAALSVEWDAAAPNEAFDSDAHVKRLEAASRETGFITRKEDAPPDTGPVTKTIEAIYHYPFYAHAPVETMNCVADVRENRCTIWAPTQAPERLQRLVGELLGIPRENVEVNVTLVGGGFGRRLGVDYAVEAAAISRAAKAPVQLLWSRADDMKHGHFQAASAHYLSAGFDANNKPVAWKHTKAGSYHNISPLDPEDQRNIEWYQGWSWGCYDVPYAFPAVQTAYVAVDLPVKHGPWRAVFAPSSVFAREGFVDEVAQSLGADPLTFRLDMLKGADVIKAGDATIDRRRLRRVLQTVRQKSGWGEKLEKGRGRGVACNAYFGYTYIAYVVDVSVDQEQHVRVDRVVAAVDCGLVVNPVGVEQQMESGIIWGISSVLGGEITFKGGSAQQNSFADFAVARMRDVPPIEVHIIGADAAEPFGMGEPPVPPIVPAITNAIFAATGKRIRRLPVRPEMLAG